INGTSLGPPQVINGFANGWYVDPASLGGAADFDVHFEWAPQRVIWIAIAVSILGVIACIAILFFGRRRARAHGRGPVESPTRPTTPAVVDLRRRGSRASVGAAVIAAVGLGAFVLLNTPTVMWQLALVLPFAALVVWAYRSPWGRGV